MLICNVSVKKTRALLACENPSVHRSINGIDINHIATARILCYRTVRVNDALLPRNKASRKIRAIDMYTIALFSIEISWINLSKQRESIIAIYYLSCGHQVPVNVRNSIVKHLRVALYNSDLIIRNKSAVIAGASLHATALVVTLSSGRARSLIIISIRGGWGIARGTYC